MSPLAASGSVGITLLLVNVTQQATGWYARWFALLVAVAVVACTSAMKEDFTPGLKAWLKWAGNALIGGFLTFSAAFGVQDVLIAPGPQTRTINTLVSEQVESRVPASILAPVPAPMYEMRIREVPQEVLIPEQGRNFASGW